MAAEAGHEPNRSYLDHNGAFHLNGAGFYNDAEEDISQELEALDGVATALAALDNLDATELGYLDGVTAGTVTASKALVAGASSDLDALTITSLTGSVQIFNGATGANEIRVPTNLADALSIESSAGDIVVVDTTTGAVAITITTSAAAGLTLASHVTLGDAKNIILNTGTGTKIGTATTQKLGFWNATPIVQPSAYTQTYATANKTVAAPTATTLTDNGGGTADGTVASAAAPTTLTDSTGLSGSHNDTLEAVTTFTPSAAWNGTDVFPSAADATAIATAITALNQNASDTAQKVIEIVTWMGVMQDNLKELTTQINALIADDLDNRQTATAIIDDLQAIGLVG